MKKKLILLDIFLTCIMFLSFIPEAFPAKKSTPPASAVKKSPVTAKDSWKSDWELTLKKAREVV